MTPCDRRHAIRKGNGTRVRRRANSKDGRTWTTIGSITLPAFGSTAVGLAVTSHTRTASATATFDDLKIDRSR